MTKNFYYSYFPEAIIKSFTALAIILCINAPSVADDSVKTDPGFTAPGSSYLSPPAPASSASKTDQGTTAATASDSEKTDKGPDAHISSDLKTDKGATPTMPTAPAPPSGLKNTDKGLTAHISSDLKTTDPQPKKDETTEQDDTEEHKEITENELRNIIKNLPEKDKTVINNIQKQISGWPKEVFSEIRDYNEFIMTVSQQAKAKYDKLSPGSKEALEVENNLRKDLSKEAVGVLAKLHITNAY